MVTWLTYTELYKIRLWEAADMFTRLTCSVLIFNIGVWYGQMIDVYWNVKYKSIESSRHGHTIDAYWHVQHKRMITWLTCTEMYNIRVWSHD